MGGNIPFGYDLVARKLEPNEGEAATVRLIFKIYSELGSVRLLKQELDRLGLRTKRRVQQTVDGSERATGALPFGTGHLYTMLRNPIYIGKVRHRHDVHPGEHAAIVSDGLWAAVQATLDEQAVRRSTGKGTKHPSLLTGLVFTEDGRRLTPTHAVKGSIRYRYYATAEAKTDLPRIRLPADYLEQLISRSLRERLTDTSWLADVLRVDDHLPLGFHAIAAHAKALASTIDTTSPAGFRALTASVSVSDSAIRIAVKTPALSDGIGLNAEWAERLPHELQIEIKTSHQKRGRDSRLILTKATDQRQPDPTLLAAILRANRWFELLKTRQVNSIADIGQREGVARAWISNQLSLAFLAPDIVRQIIRGHQPPALNLDRMIEIANASSDWANQHRAVLRL